MRDSGSCYWLMYKLVTDSWCLGAGGLEEASRALSYQKGRRSPTLYMDERWPRSMTNCAVAAVET